MAESVWEQIDRLRQRDPALLAPVVQAAWDRGRARCAGLTVNVAGVDAPEDLVALDAVVLIETLRVQELQTIYFAQGSTKAQSVLKSWHAYGCAFDVIHRDYGWFDNTAARKRWPDKQRRAVAGVRWYRAVATQLTLTKELAWGGLWKTFPDSPHFQSAVIPVGPSQAAIEAYSKAGGGAEGRRAVHALYHLLP